MLGSETSFTPWLLSGSAFVLLCLLISMAFSKLDDLGKTKLDKATHEADCLQKQKNFNLMVANTENFITQMIRKQDKLLDAQEKTTTAVEVIKSKFETHGKDIDHLFELIREKDVDHLFELIREREKEKRGGS